MEILFEVKELWTKFQRVEFKRKCEFGVMRFTIYFEASQPPTRSAKIVHSIKYLSQRQKKQTGTKTAQKIRVLLQFSIQSSSHGD